MLIKSIYLNYKATPQTKINKKVQQTIQIKVNEIQIMKSMTDLD